MWHNIELRENGEAYNLRAYLKTKGIYYEASDCDVDNEGYKLTHFEIKATEDQAKEIDAWIKANL